MDYEETTEGIRVVVRPSFSLPYSEPGDGKFVFTYLVQMENQSEEVAQLLFRHWRIHHGEGEDSKEDSERHWRAKWWTTNSAPPTFGRNEVVRTATLTSELLRRCGRCGRLETSRDE